MRTSSELSCPGDDQPESPSSVLADEVDALLARFSATAQRLLPAMAQLILPGAPLPQTLLEELVDHRQRFNALRGRVCELGKAVGLACPPVDSLNNLGQLDALLAAVTEAETRHAGHESIRRQALKVLDRVRRITHQTAPDLPSLRSCQDAAQRLSTLINEAPAWELPTDTRALAEGQHPLACLLTLIGAGSGISDSDWEELINSVGHAFGKTLAASAARGRLVAPGSEQDTSSLSIVDLALIAEEPPRASSEPRTSFGKSVAIPRPVPLRTTRPRVVSPAEFKVELCKR